MEAPDFGRLKIRIDVDPPDVAVERRLSDEVANFINEKYQYRTVTQTDGDLPDSEWRRQVSDQAVTAAQDINHQTPPQQPVGEM
jgi:hypothetical protein